LDPKDANSHYKLGLVHEFNKDYENAVLCYKDAVELKDDHAKALNALGRVYMKTGKLTEARQSLETAKKAGPALEETAVLLNNIKDEFSPEPKKHKKKALKGKKSIKGKSVKKGEKVKSDSGKVKAKSTDKTGKRKTNKR
jgi:tetratricopeptide (TPR) repeat protein